jgi:hypothetical protein
MNDAQTSMPKPVLLGFPKIWDAGSVVLILPWEVRHISKFE